MAAPPDAAPALEGHPGAIHDRTDRLVGVLVAAAVVAAVLGIGYWLVHTVTTPLGPGAADPAEQVTIRPGSTPVVAATTGGRIVATDCVLFGPIEAVPDGTGAFRVVRGADQVACPRDEEVRTGMTLRWPPDTPPRVVPADGSP